MAEIANAPPEHYKFPGWVAHLAGAALDDDRWHVMDTELTGDGVEESNCSAGARVHADDEHLRS
jgi:hypothetical protein